MLPHEQALKKKTQIQVGKEGLSKLGGPQWRNKVKDQGPLYDLDLSLPK
jgi:hypothetical protein